MQIDVGVGDRADAGSASPTRSLKRKSTAARMSGLVGICKRRGVCRWPSDWRRSSALSRSTPRTAAFWTSAFIATTFRRTGRSPGGEPRLDRLRRQRAGHHSASTTCSTPGGRSAPRSMRFSTTDARGECNCWCWSIAATGQLPIEATFVGRTVPTTQREIVEVKLQEVDNGRTGGAR